METAGEWSISSQGRIFCQHYIIHRSLKAGAPVKKISMLFYSLSGCEVPDQVTERLLEIIRTMEHLNPSIYNSCSAKLKVTMSTDDQVRWAYESITKELLKTGVSWGKLISIFTVCGALAADCVSQGHTDFLPIILDCFEESCSQPLLCKYLKDINGWKGVIEHYDKRLSDQPAKKTDVNIGVGNIVTKSIDLFQSISKHVDKLSGSLFTFLFFMFVIVISKIFIRESKMQT